MVFTVVLLTAALILLLLWILNSRTRHARLPPGPPGIPVIGNLLQLDKKTPFKTLVKLSESYGPVMTMDLGPQRSVILVGYDAVKEALVDHADDFTGRGPLPFLIKATRGYGLTATNGESWKQLRRFTLTTLRNFGMGRKEMEEWIREESKHLVAGIKRTNGAPFDPTFYLNCAVANVICCLVFGQRFSYDDEHFLSLLRIISDSTDFAGSMTGMMYNLFPRAMEWLPGQHHEVFRKIDMVRDFTMEKIKEHQDSLDPSCPRDYIDCFLLRLQENQEKDRPNTEFHFDHLVSTVLSLYFAGTDTTSSTIRYTLSVLIKYPKIQEKMQQEIDSVIEQGRWPSVDDRKSLPFTDAVLHETQRYLDLAPFNLPHYALHDISFRGYTIPKDTVIFPLLHSVLKDDKMWDTPESFNPQHFLDGNGNFKKNPAFLPFSAGKRACVGESLARMEIFLFTVSVLQRFTVTCPGGPDSLDITPDYSTFANVPPKHQIIATPRW